MLVPINVIKMDQQVSLKYMLTKLRVQSNLSQIRITPARYRTVLQALIYMRCEGKQEIAVEITANKIPIIVTDRMTSLLRQAAYKKSTHAILIQQTSCSYKVNITTLN